MNDNDYASGEWGMATFPKKKGYKGNITAFGQIKVIEKKVLMFEDDFTSYLIDRKDFTFEKKNPPVQK